MGSFFDFMGRMVKGKPVFEQDKSDKVSQSSPTTSPQQNSAIQKGNASSFPLVYVTFVKEHISGQTLQVYCRIRNTWPNQVMLDKIRAFGTTKELDTFLRPGEEREFLVYSGPKFSKEYPDARLDYKTQAEGDYFESVHMATFSFRPEDKTYSVTGMRFHPPVLDIYG